MNCTLSFIGSFGSAVFVAFVDLDSFLNWYGVVKWRLYCEIGPAE